MVSRSETRSRAVCPRTPSCSCCAMRTRYCAVSSMAAACGGTMPAGSGDQPMPRKPCHPPPATGALEQRQGLLRDTRFVVPQREIAIRRSTDPPTALLRDGQRSCRAAAPSVRPAGLGRTSGRTRAWPQSRLPRQRRPSQCCPPGWRSRVFTPPSAIAGNAARDHLKVHTGSITVKPRRSTMDCFAARKSPSVIEIVPARRPGLGRAALPYRTVTWLTRRSSWPGLQPHSVTAVGAPSGRGGSWSAVIGEGLCLWGRDTRAGRRMDSSGPGLIPSGCEVVARGRWAGALVGCWRRRGREGEMR